MGADGGTIPKRCELVKKKKKTEKLDRAIKNATKWRNCQLTQQPLKKPIIACRYGRLYNKETVIEAILTKTITNYEVAAHIRGVKDFKELKLTENKDFKHDEVKGDEYLDYNQTQFLCPVTSVPMNGNHNFVVNWKCGCVFSEKALQEVKSETCHGCAGPWNPEESVQLYPEDELLQEYVKKLAVERAYRKNKKEKSKGDDEKQKNRKSGQIDHLTDRSRKVEKRKVESESEIQADPTKSASYKKLFTTCEEAKAKPEGHWVTFNPLYY
uniref:Replication termination factor 2 n=1 Tax=Heterorhabditis bacteriophora TaxID=37862 RepID=A0A1I7XGP8_HETBA